MSSNQTTDYKRFYFKAVFNRGERVDENIRYYQVTSAYAKAFEAMIEEDYEICEIYCEDTGVRCAIIEQYGSSYLADFNGAAVYGRSNDNATVDHIKIDYLKLQEIRQKQGGR